jgi:hypothetical protein
MLGRHASFDSDVIQMARSLKVQRNFGTHYLTKPGRQLGLASTKHTFGRELSGLVTPFSRNARTPLTSYSRLYPVLHQVSRALMARLSMRQFVSRQPISGLLQVSTSSPRTSYRSVTVRFANQTGVGAVASGGMTMLAVRQMYNQIDKIRTGEDEMSKTAGVRVSAILSYQGHWRSPSSQEVTGLQ